MSDASSELSARATCASRQFDSTAGSMRAGCPTRTTPQRAGAAARRSTRLSTAALDAAQQSTRLPRWISCNTYSTTAVVLPVPGGPCTSATCCAESAWRTASRCEASRPRLIHAPSFTCTTLASAKRGSAPPKATRTRSPATPAPSSARARRSQCCLSRVCVTSLASFTTRSGTFISPSGGSSAATTMAASYRRYTTPSHSTAPSPFMRRTCTMSF
mmetsp:Transcript_13079/g.54815  ORF Transcript_13079/g.54815 Transcript_13079/m.54815 type:complete len:216 (-) Transcript_13079:519-1166(-)